MGKWTVMALRIVIVGGIAGSLFVQTVMVPLVARDMNGADPDVLELRVPFLTIVVLGIVTFQVCAVCVWKLLTMVRRGTVFTQAAFRFVDVIIGAISVASLLTFALGFLLAPGGTAPGIVLLVGGAGAVIAGIALIVLVLRALLAQAVAREAEAKSLQAELDVVI